MNQEKLKYKSLDEILRAYLDRQSAEREGKIDFDWWWASELGLCKRKHLLRRLKIRSSNGKPWRIRFLGMDGKASHEWREKAVGTMGALIEREGKLRDPELRYSGRFDLIINILNQPVLCDIKTQRPEAFFKRAKQKPELRVKEFQQMQLGSYIYFFNKLRSDSLTLSGFPTGTKIKEGRIYYVDRGGGVREEFIFHFGEEMAKKVLGELQELNTAWKEGKIPDRTDQKWECRYCPYKAVCKEVDKNELTIKQIIKNYGQEK